MVEKWNPDDWKKIEEFQEIKNSENVEKETGLLYDLSNLKKEIEDLKKEKEKIEQQIKIIEGIEKEKQNSVTKMKYYEISKRLPVVNGLLKVKGDSVKEIENKSKTNLGAKLN